MDNVFQRFNINTADVSPTTVLHIHRVYTEILASLNNTSNEDGDLSSRRERVKKEWLSTADLPTSLHDIIDDTEALVFTAAFEDDIKLLAPAYTRILALASELKRHLDDQVNRVANPGGGSRNIVGTKAEAKQLREVAQSLTTVYSTLKMMNSELSDMPNLDWPKIPPGRDVSLSSTPYLTGVMRYSLTDDTWMSKSEFLDTLSKLTNKRWTRHEFDSYLEDNSLSLKGDWTHTIDSVTFEQRRFTE